MRRQIGVAAVTGAIGLASSGGASADSAATRDDAVFWQAASGQSTTLGTATRRIRISFAIDVCNPNDDPAARVRSVNVSQRRHAVVVTVLTNAAPPPDGDVCAGVAKPLTRSVKLQGRLGHRAVKDGFFRPARTVFAAPKP